MKELTFEDITKAVEEGFKAGLAASDEIAKWEDLNISRSIPAQLQYRCRSVISRVIQDHMFVPPTIIYKEDPEDSGYLWANYNGTIVYYNTRGDETLPPLSKWNRAFTSPHSSIVTPERIQLWYALLDDSEDESPCTYCHGRGIVIDAVCGWCKGKGTGGLTAK